MIDPRSLLWKRLALLVACCVIAIVLFKLAVTLLRNTPQYAGGIAARLSMGARPMNILVVANNARGVAANDPLGLGTAAGQADVIILARVDPKAHTIYAITIPRDALIAQPQWHNTVPKIKTLFFMGDQQAPPRGPEDLAAAVASLTGLPVDGYLVANFAGFKEAVDLVGGLTIDVKARIYDPVNSHADFAPGIQHMNGAQTLAFVRVRQNAAGNTYRVNDYQRMQAEVEVLGLLRNKLLDPAHVSTLLPKFVARMRHDIATNLSQETLVRVGVAMAGAPVYQVPLGSPTDSMVLARAHVAGLNREGLIEEAEYDVLDPSDVREHLAQFGAQASKSGLPPFPPPTSIHVDLYGTSHLALHLQHLGFTRIHRLGPPTGENRLVYPASHPASGWEVARDLGLGNVYVEPGDGTSVTVYQ